jgi:biopolymer transport protein ExbD
VKEAGTSRSMPVTLRADGRATHQSVVTAMDILGRLGFVELNVATVNQAETDAGQPAGRH